MPPWKKRGREEERRSGEGKSERGKRERAREGEGGERGGASEEETRDARDELARRRVVQGPCMGVRGFLYLAEARRRAKLGDQVLVQVLPVVADVAPARRAARRKLVGDRRRAVGARLDHVGLLDPIGVRVHRQADELREEGGRVLASARGERRSESDERERGEGERREREEMRRGKRARGEGESAVLVEASVLRKVERTMWLTAKPAFWNSEILQE